MPELASAWITLAASTRGMESDIRRALNRVENGAKLEPKVDVSRLSAQGEKAGEGFGRSFLAKFDDAAQKAEGVGASGGSGAGASFMAGFSDKIGGLGSKAGPIGLALAAAAGTALAGGKLIADQIFAGMEQQQSRANVQAKLGIDDASMAQIADAAGKAYAGNFGESVVANMEAARAAIQGGLLEPGAGSASTRKLIEQLTTVSDVLGEDIPAVTRSATQAIRTGMASDATSAFDLIVKGQQAGLNSSQDWLDTLNEYSTQFRKLGLDGAEATGLLSQMLKGGARDTDVAADALKEFSIRVVDGSKLTADSFAALNLNADEMAAKFAAGGPSAKAAFDQVVDAVRSVQDPLKRAQILVGLFGTQAEDLGGAWNSMDLSTAVAQLGQFEGAAQRASDTIGGTASSSWESFTRTIETSVDGMQDSLATAFGPVVDDFAKGLTDHQPEILGFFTTVGEGAAFGAESILHFVADSSRAMAQFVNAIGDTYGGITKVGARVKELFGDEEGARQWYADAEAGFGLGDPLYEVANSADAALASASGARERISELGEQSQNAAELNRALGKTVAEIPDGKTITITDNTPEATERLRALGITVQSTPTGLKLTATTSEAQRIIDSFIAEQTGRPIEPPVQPNLRPANAAMQQFLDQWTKAIIAPQVAVPGQAPPSSNPLQVIAPRAAGGVFLPDHAVIQPATAGLVQWAEPSTGGEAFIPLRGGQRSRNIWAQTGRLLGIFEQGGIRGSQGGLQPNAKQLWDILAQAFPELETIGGYRQDPHPDHPSGQALDIMIPGGTTRGGVNPVGKQLGDSIWAFLEQNAAALGVDISGSLWQTDTGGDHYNHIHARTTAGPATGAALASFNGASGAYGYGEPDPQKIANAEENLRAQRADVAIQEQELRELKADADQSQRMRVEEQLRKAKADEAKAVRELDEARRGEPLTQSDLRSGKGEGAAGAGLGQNLGQSIFSGFLQAIGLDGSVFSNPLEWPNVKSGIALANWGGGLLKSMMGGGDTTTPYSGGGGLSMPGLGDFLKPISPGSTVPIGTPASGVGSGPAPGPTAAIINNGTIGMDPRALTQRLDAHQNQAYRRNLSSVRPK